jgi:hypothetical protein
VTAVLYDAGAFQLVRYCSPYCGGVSYWLRWMGSEAQVPAAVARALCAEFGLDALQAFDAAATGGAS